MPLRQSVAKPIRRFLADRSGATAIEYGLICGLIFLAIVAPLRDLLGVQLQTLFNTIAAQMK